MDAKKPMMNGQMMECCQAMKDQKKTMMMEIKTQDVALTAAIAKMNSATGAEKNTQMAAILTTMVEQRTAMHNNMAKMDEQMMDHMMGHMPMGTESMPQRPMGDDIDKKAGNFRGHK